MRRMRSDSHALVATKANVLCVLWWTRRCPGATIFLTLKYAALVVVNIGKRKKTEKCTATWNRFDTTAVLQPRTRLIKRLPNAIIPDEWWVACTCHAHWSAISMHCYDCKAKEGEQKKSWPGNHSHCFHTKINPKQTNYKKNMLLSLFYWLYNLLKFVEFPSYLIHPWHWCCINSSKMEQSQFRLSGII